MLPAHYESENPLRRELLCFFQALLNSPTSQEFTQPYSSCDNELKIKQWAQHATSCARSFNLTASRHYDRHAAPSDAIYARFVTALDYITPVQILKLCEGFRVISKPNVYSELNSAHVQHGAGVRALMHGCRHGIIPTALSYRHTLHAPPAAQTARDSAVPFTVSRETAERFVQMMNRGRNAYSKEEEIVVWIDRAVKGLSVDGEWFVRGLLPYCLVPVAAAHSGQHDFKRPWIYLEWRLSTRAFSLKGLQARVNHSDVIQIALHAMFAPARMMEEYEYAQEMEAVVQDMYVFGMCAMAGKRTDAAERMLQTRQWDDYKVGLVTVFSLTCSEYEDDREARYGALEMTHKDPYACGLFTDELHVLLGSVGVRFGSPSSKVYGYKLVEGSFVMVQEKNDSAVICTRLPRAVMQQVRKEYEDVSIETVFRQEVEALAQKYDLRLTTENLKFQNANLLTVLACCDVRTQKGRQRRKGMDDADAALRKNTAVKCGVADESPSLCLRYDETKAAANICRRQRYSLCAWMQRVQKSQMRSDRMIASTLPKRKKSTFLEKRHRKKIWDTETLSREKGRYGVVVVYRRLGVAGMQHLVTDGRQMFCCEESMLQEA